MDRLKEFKETLILGGIILFVFILTFVSLFAFGGISESEYISKTSFYWISLSIIFTYVLLVGVYQYASKKGDRSPLNLIIFDQDYSVLNMFGIKIKTSTLIFSSILIFLTLGFISASTGQTLFTGIQNIEYQVAETGEVVLSSEPASLTETLLFLIPVSFLFSWVHIQRKKKKMKEWVALVWLLGIIPIIKMLGWWGLHLYRYGSSEIAQWSVAFFGFSSTLLTTLTGTFIVEWIWHFFNNAYGKMGKLLTQDQLLLVTIILAVLTGLIWLYTYYRRKLKDEN